MSCVYRNIVGATQRNKKGIGYSLSKPFSIMNQRECRSAAIDCIKTGEAGRSDVHLIRCAQQRAYGQMRREYHLMEIKLG